MLRRARTDAPFSLEDPPQTHSQSTHTPTRHRPSPNLRVALDLPPHAPLWRRPPASASIFPLSFRRPTRWQLLYVILEGSAVALRTEPCADSPAPPTADEAGDGDETPPLELPCPGLRFNRPTHEEVVTLCELEAGAFFGERALLYGEQRYASIQATTPLRTMAITREAIESVIGRPLYEIIGLDEGGAARDALPTRMEPVQVLESEGGPTISCRE